MRRNIALMLSYDGTDFAGWQVQKGERTVQGVVEEALGELHGEPVKLIGAGRTDSGVHAGGQVGNFRTSMDSVPAERFRDALNARLPPDIRIRSSTLVSDNFHARRDARARCYEYRMMGGMTGPADRGRFTWLVRRIPPLGILNDMAGVICGTHDFTAFTAAGDASPHRIRDVYHARFLGHGPLTLFRIRGNAFLWRMVRSLLGTMINLASRGGGEQAMRDILESRDRDAAGPTAPPRGLFLTRVDYGTTPGFH